MNIRKIKLIAYNYNRFVVNYLGDHIYKQIETFTSKIETFTSKQRNGIDGVMTFTTTNHIGDSHYSYDVKFGHVTSRDTMSFMEL